MIRKLQLILAMSTIMLSLLACAFPSTEELLRARIDTLALNDLESSLVFEQSVTSSGATGACNSTWLDRWYGTGEDYDAVMQAYEERIATEDWEIWPEDVTQIWRLQTGSGLFSLVLVDITGTINPERGDYVLPPSAIEELKEYRTAYLLRLGYMTNSQTRRCFAR